MIMINLEEIFYFGNFWKKLLFYPVNIFMEFRRYLFDYGFEIFYLFCGQHGDPSKLK